MKRKSFAVDVSEELPEQFSEQADSFGYTKYRAIEGALRAWMALPPDLQVKLMSNSTPDVRQSITESLLGLAIQAHLDELGPAKEEFLALLKQAKEQAAQKKT